MQHVIRRPSAGKFGLNDIQIGFRKSGKISVTALAFAEFRHHLITTIAKPGIVGRRKHLPQGGEIMSHKMTAQPVIGGLPTAQRNDIRGRYAGKCPKVEEQTIRFKSQKVRLVAILPRQAWTRQETDRRQTKCGNHQALIPRTHARSVMASRRNWSTSSSRTNSSEA